MTGFSERAEQRLDQIAEATRKAATLESEVAKLKADIEALETRASTAEAEIQAKAEEYRKSTAELTAQLETAKRATSEAIAAQGIPTDKIPSQSATGPGEHISKPDTSKMSLTEQCLAARKQKIVTK